MDENDELEVQADTGNDVTAGETISGKRQIFTEIGDPEIDFDVNRSYKHVMAKKNDDLFTVTVDGQKYDTRKGMTDAAYDALYDDSKSRGATLPDSKQMGEENSDLWTYTMLTGEPLTGGGGVRVRYVYGGDVYGGIDSADRGARRLRVRPAVEI